MPNDLWANAESEEDADVGGDLEGVAEVGAVAATAVCDILRRPFADSL